MSGHRRVKNVGYDDDDVDDEFDEYEADEYGAENGGGDDMTAEDRGTQNPAEPKAQRLTILLEQLAEGTVKVRAALGSDAQATDFEIQEALWHYWFDIEKTVIYLKNKHQPQQQHKQAKAASRFDQAAAASAVKADETLASGSPGKFSHDSSRLGMDYGLGRLPWTRRLSVEANEPLPPASSLFSGIPWTGVSQERLTTLSPTVVRHQPRMLGGSGKPSKLAALAAARKAKEASAKGTASTDSAPLTSNAISLLDRLGAKAGPTTTPGPGTQPTFNPPSRMSIRPKSPPTPEPRPPPHQSIIPELHEEFEEVPEQTPTPLPGLEELQCSPSTFAQDFSSPLDRNATPFNRRQFCTNISTSLIGNTLLFSPSGFSNPSPDAIVLQAQTKGKTPASKKKENGAAKVTKAVDDLSIDDLSTPVKERPRVATKVQSKNLNVAQEYAKAKGKKESNFVVVGHIDHGKSTLMGRLLYDHKVIDQRSLEKFRREAAKIGKESFALAWVMDAREDEREHGVTIDYAEKTFETEKAIFTIIDAPGHRDFVGNMIAGTSMADFALMVIDAGTNSFEAGLKGQTREHAQIVRCMKLDKIIIAVNKMDSVSWSQEAFDGVRHKATAILEELLFNPDDLLFVPCSGLTGDNIISPPTEAPWYSGPTLVHTLENLTPNSAQYLGPLTAPFRLRIAAFTGLSEHTEFMATGAQHEPFTAFGRIDAGAVQVGDALVCQPGAETCVVMGITRHGAQAPWAVAGQIVGLQLTDCDEERFAKGDVLCVATRPVKPVRTVQMKILAFDAVFPMPVDVYRGRLRAAGRIVEVLATLDKSPAVVRERPKVVRHGNIARVRVEFDEPVALERRTRVVLRYGGETIAAGAVEKGE